MCVTWTIFLLFDQKQPKNFHEGAEQGRKTFVFFKTNINWMHQCLSWTKVNGRFVLTVTAHMVLTQEELVLLLCTQKNSTMYGDFLLEYVASRNISIKQSW